MICSYFLDTNESNVTLLSALKYVKMLLTRLEVSLVHQPCLDVRSTAGRQNMGTLPYDLV